MQRAQAWAVAALLALGLLAPAAAARDLDAPASDDRHHQFAPDAAGAWKLPRGTYRIRLTMDDVVLTLRARRV